MQTLKVAFLLILASFQFPVFSQDSTNVFSCGFDESELDGSLLKNIDTRNFKVSQDGFYIARIAIDVDYDTYQYFNFNEELIRFELNKMIQKVSMLYEKEINTKLIVSEVHIWKSENEDPYRNEFDIYRMLSLLRENVLEKSIFSLDFDFYMYLPTKNFLGAGGLASQKGNVSPWGIYKTIAHEIGHNFGSPHTQSCNWEDGPLDFCYPSEGNCYDNALEDVLGTVMSYCSYRQSSFHPKVRAVLSNYSGQHLRFIDNTPSSPVLEAEIVNSFNVPYTSFNPVFEANKYYYEIASNSSFENIIFSDTTNIPTIYFDNYSSFEEYYLRVKSINQKEASLWSNTSKIVKRSNKLGVPIPDPTYNKKYLNLFSNITNERLNFTAVKNAEGYDIEVFRYSKGSLPIRNYFSYDYQSTINSITIKEVTNFFKTDFLWRVRAYSGNEKGEWSEFQYVFDQTESIISNFNLNGPLPTSFTINRNNNYETITNYTLVKTDNDEMLEIPEGNIVKEKNRYVYLNLEPNSSYKLTSTVSINNHEIWEGKKSGVQYSFEKNLSTSNESLPTNWELFTLKDSTIDLMTSSMKFSKDYFFVLTNKGLLRYNLGSENYQIFNTENSQGLIGNQIELMELDKENNLWLFQKISKKIGFSGAFPNPVYSIMKFNPENMTLLERTDFEHNSGDYINSFDPSQKLFCAGSKLFKVVNEKSQTIYDFTEINNSSNQTTYLGFYQNKYWLNRKPANSDYDELLAINIDNTGTEAFNHLNYPNLPSRFSEIFFDAKDNPLILSSTTNKVFKRSGNQFVIEADLDYPGGFILWPTYNQGIFTSRIYTSPGDGIFKFYNSEWDKVSEYPEYIYGFYQYFTDQTGNVWLNTNNSLIKLNVCSGVSEPIVNAESEVNYGNATTISVSGCSDLNWSFNNLNGEITNDNITSKTINSNSSFSYQISCNDNGCTSNDVQGNVAVIPKLLVNSVASNTVCSTDLLRYAPSIEGQYREGNKFNVVLSNNEGQFFEINGNEVAEGPYPLDNTIPAGTYWTKLKSSNPESLSSDSVLVTIVKSADVNITGIPDICNGQPGLLTAEVTGNGPFNYFWANGQAQVLSRAIEFTITNSGTYQLGVVDANNCTFISEFINSHKIELSGNIDVDGSTELAADQTVNLMVDYKPNWTYEWKLNNETTNFGSTNLITVSNPGIYTVEIKQAGCVFETEGVQIKQILASKEENPKWEVKIAPNPAEKYLYITLPTNNAPLVSFKIISTEGKLLKAWKSSAKVQRIDISNLEAGLYYLKSQTDNETSTHKFVRN